MDYCYCPDCDITTNTDHFNEFGECEFADLREVLAEAREPK